jgi:hypothetical protein
MRILARFMLPLFPESTSSKFYLLLNKVSFDLDDTPEVLLYLALSLRLRYLVQQQPCREN